MTKGNGKNGDGKGGGPAGQATPAPAGGGWSKNPMKSRRESAEINLISNAILKRVLPFFEIKPRVSFNGAPTVSEHSDTVP